VMAEGFLREKVGAWLALDSAEAQRTLFNAVLPTVDGAKVVPRWGFGPRLIYLVGGEGEGGRLSTVQLYDPQNASWTQLASMTAARSSHGCVALDGKLYAVGGYDADSQMLDTAEVYDPQTDGWQPLAKMTTARGALGLAAVGGKIYAIGGHNDGGALESVEAYDPQLGAWALLGLWWQAWVRRAVTMLLWCLTARSTPWVAMEEAHSTRWRCTTLRPTAGSGWRACREGCMGTPLQRWGARCT
jgi:hypothetical protein